MTFQAGQLENSLARPDSEQNIHSSYNRKIKFINGKRRLINYDGTGTFRTNHSLTNGPHVTIESYDDLPAVTYYLNDDATFNRAFTGMEDLVGTGWSFDWDAGTITTGTVIAESGEELVKNGNVYTSATTTSTNFPTDFQTDISLSLILDDLTEVSIGWNDTVTFASTTSLKYKLTNDKGSSTIYDMFDSIGKVPLLKIKYS